MAEKETRMMRMHAEVPSMKDARIRSDLLAGMNCVEKESAGRFGESLDISIFVGGRNHFVDFNIASKNFQNLSTVSICIFSSGECTPSSVGPKETISIPGNFSPMMPHSSPA